MTMHNVQAGGASIPSLGFGTWAARGDECAQAVTWALESGYRHVDTAAVYANEEAVGDGIRASRVPRGRDLPDFTKVGPDDIDEDKLERSAEASLKRLGFDHVDLLLIHWPSPKIPLKRSMAALAKAKRRGLTRHIGVSNFTPALIAEALALSEEPIVTNQCEYHPRLDHPVDRRCRQKEVSFTPLPSCAGCPHRPEGHRIAKRHGKTPAQVRLRWQVQQQGVISIPKSANRQRIAEYHR